MTNRQPQGRSTTQADCRWHGRGQGFESPKLHSLFPLIRREAHRCHFSALFGSHWTRGADWGARWPRWCALKRSSIAFAPRLSTGRNSLRLHCTWRRQDRQHTAESGLFHQGAARARRGRRRVLLLRAGLAPAFCGRGDVTQGRRAAGAPARGACTRPAGCGRRRSGARSSRGRRPGSRRRCVLRPWPR